MMREVLKEMGDQKELKENNGAQFSVEDATLQKKERRSTIF